MTLDLATVTRETFDAHVGTRFTMHVAEGRTLELELVGTQALPTRPGAGRASFLLRFRASDGTHVPQRTYALEHPVLGPLEIFLVPSGPDGTGMRYDAVFS